MPKGNLAFVLHAHLPFIRHPEYDSFLEERWLFEAITETYIPLIQVCERLVAEGVRFRLTVSISPSLLAMLEDPLLQERYRNHLGKLIALSESEQERLRDDAPLRRLATLYHRRFHEAQSVFAGCGGRLSTLFGRLHAAGAIELITTTATHGILPLLSALPKAAEVQLTTGLDYFAEVFGFRPRGLWLPECGWAPGLDALLHREGLRYFFVESHGIDHASVTPVYGVYAAIFTPQGVAAFGRDQASTKEVWSAEEGFPGDPDYREFYRDIGHDLDFAYIQGVLGGDIRADTGLKYYRITGQTEHKQPYDAEAGRAKAALHADVFLKKRIAHVEHLNTVMEMPPIVVAPFDAELFGHWWFEGPQWLDFLIRQATAQQDVVELTTASDYLRRHPVQQVGDPCTSSWGNAGYFDTWLNDRNDWIYNELMECGRRMEGLAARHGCGEPPAPVRRALNQCVRELLLAQSSDWPFIITAGTAAAYAARRVRDHVSRFHYLANAVEAGAIDAEHLAALEYADNIFPNADYRRFGP